MTIISISWKINLTKCDVQFSKFICIWGFMGDCFNNLQDLYSIWNAFCLFLHHHRIPSCFLLIFTNMVDFTWQHTSTLKKEMIVFHLLKNSFLFMNEYLLNWNKLFDFLSKFIKVHDMVSPILKLISLNNHTQPLLQNRIEKESWITKIIGLSNLEFKFFQNKFRDVKSVYTKKATIFQFFGHLRVYEL